MALFLILIGLIVALAVSWALGVLLIVIGVVVMLFAPGPYGARRR